MSFYSEFAPWYREVFPFREATYRFLGDHAGSAGSAVLDGGCGPGSYCGRFLSEGFRVTGIDLDPKMIDSAAAAYPAGEFRCMDIAALASLKSSFQLVYSIGNVLAYLSLDRLEQFLGDVYAALEPGGSWIFQVVNWDYLLCLQEYTFPVITIDDGQVAFHRRYRQISPEAVAFEVWLSSGERRLFHEQSELYPCSSEVFLRLHAAAGFSLDGVFAGFDKSAYLNSRNSGLVMAFRKP